MRQGMVRKSTVPAQAAGTVQPGMLNIEADQRENATNPLSQTYIYVDT